MRPAETLRAPLNSGTISRQKTDRLAIYEPWLSIAGVVAGGKEEELLSSFLVSLLPGWRLLKFSCNVPTLGETKVILTGSFHRPLCTYFILLYKTKFIIYTNICSDLFALFGDSCKSCNIVQNPPVF